MKKLLVFVMLIQFGFSALAQDQKSILGSLGGENQVVKTAFFIQPQIKASFNNEDFLNSPSTQVGGKIGVILNQSFVVALSGYAKTGKLKFEDQTGTMGLGYGYGGCYLGYKVAAKEIIHPEFGITAGYGGASEYYYINGYKGAHHAAGFLYVEPEVTVQIRISNMVSLALGANYRWLDYSNFELLPDNQLNGFAVSGGIAFQL